ncbi:MAG: hypothetical protein ACK5LF_14595 [Bacteroides xylanisolvens]
MADNNKLIPKKGSEFDEITDPSGASFMGFKSVAGVLKSIRITFENMAALFGISQASGQSTTLAPSLKLFSDHADDTSKHIANLITSPSAGDALVYDGSKWVNKTKSDVLLNSQFAVGNFLLPLFPVGNKSEALLISVKTTIDTQIVLNGDGFLYTDPAATQGKNRAMALTAGVLHDVYVKINDVCSIIVQNGINAISELVLKAAVTDLVWNMPVIQFDARNMPGQLTLLHMQTNVYATGNLTISSLPKTLVKLYFLENLNMSVSGTTSDFKAFAFQEALLRGDLISISGDLFEMIQQAKMPYITLVSNANLTYTGGIAITQTMSNINITAGSLTSSMVDNLLVDLAAANWGGYKIVTILGQPHTSAGNAAIATLLSKGVTVTVN